ncbi:hypothetical protein TNCV_3308201 [Trichonephila clavipes]|nr:hypothetical protein TNCV_3308201 [Trichonephila clavipes]
MHRCLEEWDPLQNCWPNNVTDIERIPGIRIYHNNIIVGDFNVHSTRWGYFNTHVTSKAVEELLDSSSLIRIPSRSTFLPYGSLIPVLHI